MFLPASVAGLGRDPTPGSGTQIRDPDPGPGFEQSGTGKIRDPGTRIRDPVSGPGMIGNPDSGPPGDLEGKRLQRAIVTSTNP